jgi:hypothetical protein
MTKYARLNAELGACKAFDWHAAALCIIERDRERRARFEQKWAGDQSVAEPATRQGWGAIAQGIVERDRERRVRAERQHGRPQGEFAPFLTDHVA